MFATRFINVPDWSIQLGNEGKPSFRRADRRAVAKEGHHTCTILYCLGLGSGSARYTSAWIFVSHLRALLWDRHGLLTKYPTYRSVKRTVENLAANDVELNEEDLTTVSKFLETHAVVGDRYFGNDAAAHLWG